MRYSLAFLLMLPLLFSSCSNESSSSREEAFPATKLLETPAEVDSEDGAIKSFLGELISERNLKLRYLVDSLIDEDSTYQLIVEPLKGVEMDCDWVNLITFYSGPQEIDSCMVTVDSCYTGSSLTQVIYEVPLSVKCDRDDDIPAPREIRNTISGLVVLLDDVGTSEEDFVNFREYNYTLQYAGASSTILGTTL